ncbi:unnamed protein product, partial [Amoebophrya sp. A120]
NSSVSAARQTPCLQQFLRQHEKAFAGNVKQELFSVSEVSLYRQDQKELELLKTTKLNDSGNTSTTASALMNLNASSTGGGLQTERHGQHQPVTTLTEAFEEPDLSLAAFERIDFSQTAVQKRTIFVPGTIVVMPEAVENPELLITNNSEARLVKKDPSVLMDRQEYTKIRLQDEEEKHFALATKIRQEVQAIQAALDKVTEKWRKKMCKKIKTDWKRELDKVQREEEVPPAHGRNVLLSCLKKKTQRNRKIGLPLSLRRQIKQCQDLCEKQLQAVTRKLYKLAPETCRLRRQIDKLKLKRRDILQNTQFDRSDEDVAFFLLQELEFL